MSRLTLGTANFGDTTDASTALSMLDLFVDRGGTLVDTADKYNAGASEEIIGRWYASRPSTVTERVVLATKARFQTDEEPNGIGLSRRHLQRALDGSLRRLGVETVDLYQLHSWDPLTPLDETLRFIDETVEHDRVADPGGGRPRPW